MPEQAANSAERCQSEGLPLTPAVVRKLIIELFAGRTAERQQIVKAVANTHETRGGGAARTDLSKTVMRALHHLKNAGLAANPQLGFWRIANEGAAEAVIAVAVEEEELEPAVKAEIILGKGDCAVYLYYFPTYRANAKATGALRWPCKIGRSDRDPINRVLSQASTALPEYPVIGILLRTDLPSQWETVSHNILGIRGQVIDEAPGDEWFNTSVEDVLRIIEYTDPSLKAGGQK